MPWQHEEEGGLDVCYEESGLRIARGTENSSTRCWTFRTSMVGDELGECEP